MHRIYLDNAATSWPKPQTVYEAVSRYLRDVGAAAGRSAYREANQVEREVQRVRQLLASMINAEDANRIVFTSNGTDSLNLALHGLLRPGDHVITSVVEHNSVLRPLHFLEQHRHVEVTRVPCGATGVIDPDDVRHAIRSNTRLIALIHASNVTGAIQPVEAVGQLAHEHGIRYLVDVAQSLGHVPLDVRCWFADLVAAPGHKGLMGPLGTGLLYVADGVEADLQPVRQGGTGTDSESESQPASMPERFECGNHNVPGILGLGAGVAYLLEQGIDTLQRHDQQLTARLLVGLRQIEGVTVHGPVEDQPRVGVVSISIAGYDPQEVAGMLDASCSIQVRSGLHCAPRMHQALGTDKLGGTVRFSLGAFSEASDIDTAIGAIEEIASSGVF